MKSETKIKLTIEEAESQTKSKQGPAMRTEPFLGVWGGGGNRNLPNAENDVGCVFDAREMKKKFYFSSSIGGRSSCAILFQNQIRAASSSGKNTVFSENHTLVKPPFCQMTCKSNDNGSQAMRI